MAERVEATSGLAESSHAVDSYSVRLTQYFIYKAFYLLVAEWRKHPGTRVLPSRCGRGVVLNESNGRQLLAELL